MGNVLLAGNGNTYK